MNIQKVLNLFQAAKNQVDNEDNLSIPRAHFIIAVTIHNLGYENIDEIKEEDKENTVDTILNALKNFFLASGDMYLYLLKLGFDEDEAYELVRR